MKAILTAWLARVRARWANFEFLKFVKEGDRVLKFVGRLFVLWLVIWILWAFRQAYNNDNYTIEPFGVPPTLVERGYSGDVVVEKILSDAQRILSKKYYDERNPEAYRKLVSQPTLSFSSGSRAGYFDLQSLFQVGKLLLGKKDKTIKGHITRDDGWLRLYVRLPDDVSETFSVRDTSSMDVLLEQAAIFLIKKTTPQYLAYYFVEKGDFQRAEELLQFIDFKLNQQKTEKTYDQSRIQWFLSQTTLEMARKNWELALEKSARMQEAYPNDLATYVQQLNILTNQAIALENARVDNTQLVTVAQKAVQTAQNIIEKDYKSVYLDPKKSLGWVYANWAYMLQKTNASDADVLAKYERGIELLPNAATPYNNLSYFYMDKKNYAEAEKQLQRALIADRNNGNTWDTFAELMLLKGDTTRCLDYLEQALMRPNSAEGISSKAYLTDVRWTPIQQNKRFQNILEKYAVHY